MYRDPSGAPRHLVWSQSIRDTMESTTVRVAAFTQRRYIGRDTWDRAGLGKELAKFPDDVAAAALGLSFSKLGPPIAGNTT
jgi:hypothetical protein